MVVIVPYFGFRALDTRVAMIPVMLVLLGIYVVAVVLLVVVVVLLGKVVDV